ncbi:type II toxin-antitoxin system Phd/YefM family antitoxin [Flavonifractor sp. An100]|jgi:PHD/YefM family antitoxin component YafN of YafNO toxin-antitoxin module|uniref:type II toxin-antitoxin system Phd/YefM family antitoxin n=1 Tax=Flavonifractor sp. An100 TaxID=1965538 RepID=UPI000B3B05B5|nr:type II toxin-antitoxin system Phd/YefM family antitoxin [Flavonifractor sp. An100]OUQ76587.1 prevent-host-death protein [Flavonifractor sp. An100]
MPKIIPIRDLKNTTAISECCHAVGEPIFVTKNGYGDMVVMSMEAYEERMRMLDVYAKLASAEQQVASGQVLSAEDSLKGLREKYGL